MDDSVFPNCFGKDLEACFLQGFPYHGIYRIFTVSDSAAGELIIVVFQTVYHSNLPGGNNNTAGRIAYVAMCTLRVVFPVKFK